MTDRDVTRRRLLGAAAGALATGAAGLAGADPVGAPLEADLDAAGDDAVVRVNVGYDSAAARRAAVAAAEEVFYEFGFDALTATLPADAASDLRARGDVRYVERDATVRALGHAPWPDGRVWVSSTSEGTEASASAGDAGASAGADDGSPEAEARAGDRSVGAGSDDTGVSSDSGAAQLVPWGIDRVDADVVHHEGETAEGAHVAIVDTGIDAAHLELNGNLGSGAGFLGGVRHPDFQDDNGHGTHCAGIADALNDAKGVVGVATAATLHPVKVLTAAGVGLTSDVARGVEYVADQGWDVASLSLGGPSSEVLREACAAAYEKGVLVVAAAGNSGPCEDCVGYPAAYDSVVAVSATTESDSFASFSSQGPEVEIAAPGQSILSTFVGNAYAILDGTSMAAPHVAGAGGHLMAGGYSNTEARDRLTGTAEDIGLPENRQGAGLLDVASALGSSDSGNGSSGDGSSGGDGSAPSASIDEVTETRSPNPHAEFDVSWSAGDSDGDLESVTLQLRDTSDGQMEDSAEQSVSGSSASGTTTLTAHKDDGSGHEYEVTLHVRDGAGNSARDTATVTEDGSASSNGGGNGS